MTFHSGWVAVMIVYTAIYTAQMKLKTKHIHNFSTQTSNDPLEIVRQMAWIYP